MTGSWRPLTDQREPSKPPEQSEKAPAALDIEIRAGLHTGVVELRGPDISGIAVNIAARVQACADPSEVLVSRTLADLLAGSNFEFSDRGSHELKGVSGAWQLYAVS